MKADTLTPVRIFSESGIREVPLFQRKYVWSEDRQWRPLWNDVMRLSDALLLGGFEPAKHFMGAVVLQQLPKRTGALQRISIIDGQQRLTTLQILFDAIRKEAARLEVPRVVSRMEALLINPKLEQEEDPVTRFKLHPTNKDQETFFELIGSEAPQYNNLRDPLHRLAKAHKFFREQCADWLIAKTDKAEAIEKLSDTVRELLSIAVIDLEPDENAQEIFETLNARGTPLTAADLIKNFVFQKIREKTPHLMQKMYSHHWVFFESDFWESKVTVSGNQMNRTSIFFGQWLVAKTAEEIASRDIFYRFKRFVGESESNGIPVDEILREIHRVAGNYEDAFAEALTKVGDLSPMAHFIYRTQAMKVDSATPVLIAMIGHKQGLPDDLTLRATLNVLESWLVRRMLLKRSTKNYPGLMVKLVKLVNEVDPQALPVTLESMLAQQAGDLAWPSDQTLLTEMAEMPVYQKLSRSRVRMILEAIEDHHLGWGTEAGAYQETRVKRHSLHIEHLMPQDWSKHWPLLEDRDEEERDALVHRLGNLTLLPQRLNSKVSNGPWFGPNGKVENLRKYDNLLINRRLLGKYGDYWSEDQIGKRTVELIEVITEVWPVPQGHAPQESHEVKPPLSRVDLTDLLAAGLLGAGTAIYPRGQKFSESVGTINAEGMVEVSGQSFSSLSAAAEHFTGRPTNGWWWWCVEVLGEKQELREVRQEYLDAQGFEDVEDAEDGEVFD